MTSSHRITEHPFTIAICGNCPSSVSQAVVAELRASIRRCRHGMLVTTACMLGPMTCAVRSHGPGVMLLLQPCSHDRNPIGPAQWIGPVNDESDLRTLRDWLERGTWDGRTLPDHLRAELGLADRNSGSN